eukprot:GFUD01057613.1.p1 GENE.GFUD01057613.1~~GFUD01057613.1.p1  ORF type:complete len:179 (-),score=42.39 GFUD01057613.1:277-813(-)
MSQLAGLQSALHTCIVSTASCLLLNCSPASMAWYCQMLLLLLVHSSLSVAAGPSFCDTEQNTVLPLRCFEVNGCPGLYWHGQKACSKSLVASAISSLNRKSLKVRKINIDSDGSDKVNVEFIDRSDNLNEKPSKMRQKISPNTLSLRQTAYLPAHQKVTPVFWSGRHYLQIAEFSIPR